MYFYRGEIPNFGDELNTWLLPKIFPDLFNDDDGKMFLGIGSILFDYHPDDCLKVVFGSGYGGYTSLPKFDESWKIYCVRGPHTARICDLDASKVAADTAILISKFRKRQTKRRIKCGFMPHWASVDRGNWAHACEIADIHFIDPTKPVHDVIDDIASCEMLIAEAMHGAIVADALRVPWVAALPFHKSHRMKWFDWADALDVKLAHHPIWPSSVREARSALTQADALRLKNASGMLKMGMAVVDQGLVQLAGARLSYIKKKEPTLSPDTSFSRAVARLEENAAQIRQDFPFG